MIEINDSSNNATNKVISKTKEEGGDKEADLSSIKRKGCFRSITFDCEIMYYIFENTVADTSLIYSILAGGARVPLKFTIIKPYNQIYTIC